MLVFTITNTETNEIYVGTSKDSCEVRWAQLVTAALDGGESHLYEDIREFGEDCFEIEEYAHASTPAEMREIMSEAIETLGAHSLAGNRTSHNTVLTPPPKRRPKAVGVPLARGKAMEAIAARELAAAEAAASARGRRPAVKAGSAAGTATSAASRTGKAAKASVDPLAKHKLPTGRTGSSAKEKRIREAIAAEKAAREEQRKEQLAQERDEMSAILARLDARASVLPRGRR